MQIKWLAPMGVIALVSMACQGWAQTDYPFRDPKLPIEQRVTDLLSRLTLDEKVSLMSGSPKIPRLGLAFTGQVEGLHGLALGGPGHWEGKGKVPLPTTTFPQERGLGNTWDPALMEKIGALEGYEARYDYQSPTYNRGGVVVRAPNVDLARDPRWGRSEESMGEDPYLVGTMSVGFMHGLQGPDPDHWQASSLMKHFLANENEDTRSSSSSDFGERLFREYYSVPFRMGFEEGGSRGVMAAYNSWNGTPMMINPVLKDVMIKEWGNDGIICTDGGALGLLITAHKSFPDKEHGSAAAVKAGINYFLDTYQPDLTKALADGLVTESELDSSLRGWLRVLVKLGEFDAVNGVPGANDPYGKIGREANDTPPWERESSKQLARLATDESIVLLKNENNTLPLDAAKLKTIAVIGPWADDVLLDWYSGTPPYSVTALQGIREAVGKGAKVVFDKGTDPAAAAALARTADVAIVVVGNHPYCNATKWAQCDTPSNGREAVDRKTIVLEQEDLVKQVYAANPHTVEVLVSSFPYAIVWSQQHVPAIVHLTHNSQELGHGLADVLFGKYSPAGRLVQTWPTGDDQLLPIMDYDLTHGRTYLYSKQKPLYPFGYGLSYTTFAYEKLDPSSSSIAGDGQVEVTVHLKNTGKRDSDEVVQLYVQHLGSAVERPQLELKGFRRIHVAAGQSADAKIMVKARDLAYWDAARHAWRVEKEPVRLLAGGSSDNLPVTAQIQITAPFEYRP
ncbi:glycoside hydrolase family 3 C-terminal domain-containing protein [Acidicapsa acidisoli]|uniref:glycoside hydrolase family 3 C-terminal domain-containing protein n=1 Tax=Acidicapsa acidisoli TaxID=1615681 RepID=UPI0021DFEB40|nr:glycoside hydrolase family 3 C-terminal domain-containing protein [Acidicapsa acidisoli]